MRAGNLIIEWDYTVGQQKNMKPTLVTDCFIYSIIKHKYISGLSFAVCAHGDHFNKEKGRKLSLARALKNANLPKEERRVIWELYRNMKPSGRW